MERQNSPHSLWVLVANCCHSLASLPCPSCSELVRAAVRSQHLRGANQVLSRSEKIRQEHWSTWCLDATWGGCVRKRRRTGGGGACGGACPAPAPPAAPPAGIGLLSSQIGPFSLLYQKRDSQPHFFRP